jgi:hypothetical protein
VQVLSLRKKRGIASVRARCEEERLRPGHKYLGTYPCDRIKPLRPRQRAGAAETAAAPAKVPAKRKHTGQKGKGRGKASYGEAMLGADGEAVVEAAAGAAPASYAAESAAMGAFLAAGAAGTRKRQRLVTKTYVDDRGFLVQDGKAIVFDHVQITPKTGEAIVLDNGSVTWNGTPKSGTSGGSVPPPTHVAASSLSWRAGSHSPAHSG